jgi:PKD repeat protein
MKRFALILIGLGLLVFANPALPESPNLLVNGDFEKGANAGGVGKNWIRFSTTGYEVTYATVSDEAHGGALAQEIMAPQPGSTDQYAGIYQDVATVPDIEYTVRAWNRTHFPGGHAYDHIARLGIDLTGGTDFQAASVDWYEFDSAKNTWHLLEIRVTATGSSLTIFLQSWRKWTSGGYCLTWFDDLEVQSVPAPVNHAPTALVAADPVSGEVPLTVTFDGSGSSDPDGDALNYSWDFGDGTQDSGVTLTHTYPSEGTYVASLTVDDGRGASDTDTVIVIVEPEVLPPVTDWPYPWIARGSKLGIHSIVAGESPNFARDLAAQGLNFAVVKAVDDLSWLKEIKQISPETITIGRLTSRWEGCPNVEDPTTDLDWLADHIMDVIAEKLALEPDLRDAIDYWEAVNEPDPPGTFGYRRLGELMIKLMQRADAAGIKLAIFSLNAGTPEWDEMIQMVNSGAFERARESGHILALHEGVFGTDQAIDYLWGARIPGSPAVEGAGALCFRYRYLYHLLEQRNAVIPLVVSEFYAGGGYSQDGTSPEEVRDRMAWYDAEAAKDYFFLSFLPFTLGPVGGWHRQDYTWAYPRLLEYMAQVGNRENAAPPVDDDDDDAADNLVFNGDFENGLNQWTPWIQRGTLNPTVASGQLHMQSGNHNGGLYQQFNTGGAGTQISIRGDWASEPTAAHTQWAEVLIINGARLPADGEDINDSQSDVMLIYKNDTWATTGGWSGEMPQTAPVANLGAFVAADDVATIILKSGNVGGTHTGTRFDNILVEATSTVSPQVVLEEYFDTMEDWYDQGVQQVRHGWSFWNATGHNPLGNPHYDEPWNDWQTPEAIFRWDAFLPPDEHDILLNERGFAYKIFAGYKAWHMRLASPQLSLDPGIYRLSLKYYCDAYVDYDGRKIPPSDPLAFEAKLNLGEQEGLWVPADFLTDNVVYAEFEVEDGRYDVSFELRCRWAIRNNGAFVKWFVLEKLVDTGP